jgi:two-component system sensor histidine kinase HydH
MPIGLVAIDNNYNVTSVNQVAKSILNIEDKEVIGENAEQVLPEELWQMLDSLDDEKRIIEREIDCNVSKVKVIPIEVGATLLNDENGTFLGYVLLLKDLSEVRSLRKEIARSQRLASVGRLAAGVAHEIRNPLSSIKGFATYFKERYHDVPENQQISDLMIQEVDRLNRVVGQLHEFARPITITKKSIQLRTFIENSLKLIERQAAENDIEIQSNITLKVESALIDPDRINQVLLNLYLNAIESMGNGGKLKVTLSESTKKDGIKVQVVDTGAGIDKDAMAHIFDPYFTTKASGTGLGLAIAHNIIEAHDGDIKVESRLDQGTAITILLNDALTRISHEEF